MTLDRDPGHGHDAVDHDHVHPHETTTVPAEEHVYRERRVVETGPTGGEMIRRIVVIAFGILQSLLILRVILLLLVANAGNDVVALILGVTDPFVEPFRGMFQLDRVTGDQGSQLDIAAIVALIAWTLVEALILAVLSIGSRRGESAAI